MKIITVIALCLFLGACKPNKNLTGMDKQTFWQIIDNAKQKSRTNLDKRYRILVSTLKDYEPKDILQFHKIAGVYIGAAEENLALWGACKAIEGYASDDTYLYFCCWLVSQGYDVYKNAVKNPDSLADTPDVGKYDEDGHTFEMLMGAPFEAYELKTGESLYEIISDPEEAEKAQDFTLPLTEEEIAALLEGFEFVDDTPFRESEETAKRNVPKYLPKLTAKFGYDPEEDLREIEEFMADPEAAMSQIREMLAAQGIDVNSIPELAPQPKPESAKNYDEVWMFSNGVASVRKGDKWGFINDKGEEVIPVKYDEGSSFFERPGMKIDVTPIRYNGKYGYINKQGKELTPFKYDVASSFSYENGKYAWMEVDGKKGFVNQKGEEVIPPKYDELNFGTKLKGRIGDKWETIELD